MTRYSLPVEDCLDDLRQCLGERNEVILQAPPGAGKTTLVPLALLDEAWLQGRKILMLQPRRIATRSAAYRMASLINESPGQTVGYRMRLESRVGCSTRIEIITEGILTRMLQQDPVLSGVGLVIFDEYHERNLDSDLALALCLQGRELFGAESVDADAPLKILVMSATLDGEAISALLHDAPIVQSEGRSYPVEIIYGPARQPKERIVERVVSTIKQALQDNPDSSLLAFLPGQGEIHRCAEDLSSWLVERKHSGIHLFPLFGNLSIDEQQRAIAPLSGELAGERKVVLATNIAETSLTIEGVDVIVDSGLEREARFDPATGMTGLHTVKISVASSEQRAGRAGRLGPGKCYRLWSAEQQQQLAAHSGAEILRADLAPLAMQLLQWGVDDPAELRWLDRPPPGPWQQALELLDMLGAIESKRDARVLTPHGRAMSALPAHPRLGHLLLRGAEAGLSEPAALLASLLADRDPFSQENPDISHRLDLLSGETRCPPKHQGWLARTRKLAAQFEALLPGSGARESSVSYLLGGNQVPGYLLALAYPERIARRRHSGGYQLANGRSANLVGEHHLGKNRWLAVAEISSVTGGRGDLVRSAAALDESLFSSALQDLVQQVSVAEWDRKASRFIAEEQEKIGALILQRKALPEVPVAARRTALLDYLRAEDLKPLSWRAEDEQWRARVNLLHALAPHDWPDVTQASLLAKLDEWLGPYLDNVGTLKDLKKLQPGDLLHNLLSWEKQQQLAELVPTRIKVPSGSSIAIDYRQSPPVLAVKLQEMFGCEQSPTVAGGRVALLVHLLSPAGRPLQITQDLAGFWSSSYHEVKKEMKGRYPKHPWPDDPLVAIPTRNVKRRS